MIRNKAPKPYITFAKMTFITQCRILAENIHDISIKKIPYILYALLMGLLSEGFAFLTVMYFACKRRCTLEKDPIFILGHWRSGTTWLHETLMYDPRYIAPNTLECMRARTYPVDLFCLRLLKKLHLVKLEARNRPTDNVKIGIHTPQEDEFALLSLGQPSPWRRAFFFRSYGDFSEHQGWDGLSEKQLRRCCKNWIRFLARIQTRGSGKQLLLKSPQHSWRVAVLRKLFPKAKFVLIVRQPEEVYISFNGLLKNFCKPNSLSRSDPAVTEEEFLRTYIGMHDRVLNDVKGIADNCFTIVRYDDLKRDPMREITRIYQDLALDYAQPSLNKIASVLAAKPPYQSRKKHTSDFVFTGQNVTAFRLRFGLRDSLKTEKKKRNTGGKYA